MSKTYAYQARAIRVIGARTLEIDVDLGFHSYIRVLFGLRNYLAPEDNEEEGELYKRAKTRINELVYQYPSVVIRTYKGEGHTEWFCDLLLSNGEDLATKLIAEGYGKLWDGEDPRPVFDPNTYPCVALG